MSSRKPMREPEENTTYWLEQAATKLDRQVTEGVNRSGHPMRPAHSRVFGNIDAEGTRLTQLAERARMTPQAMGELVDDLVGRGYLDRVADPSDRRAKLIVLTDLGYDAVQSAFDTIIGIEADLEAVLGRSRLLQLRKTLRQIMDMS
jgi:DNA-binding MarR family transcriptional regulator